MALELENLDEHTRRLMVEELDADLHNETLYLSPRLKQDGHLGYAQLLRSALREGNPQSLSDEIRNGRILSATETRRNSRGGVSTVKVPVTAADTLAEGEFNRFYIRAVCRRSIDEGGDQVEVYRAKAVVTPRSESQAMIGNRVDARELLEDLRTHPGVDTALGLPPGPNSGLSIRLP